MYFYHKNVFENDFILIDIIHYTNLDFRISIYPRIPRIMIIVITVGLCIGINIFIILFYLFKCLTFNLRFLHLYNHPSTTLTTTYYFFFLKT